MKRIAVIGAGGFAREVAWLIRDLNRVTHQFEFLGFLVSDISLLRETDSRDEVLGDFNWLDGSDRADALAFGIGTPRTKLNLAAELECRFSRLEWPPLIHPTVQFDRDSARFERGVVLCAGSVGTVNLKFQEFSMVNLLCTIGHESVIGRGAVLNPTVNISGGVTIGEGVLIGTGAQVLQYVKVGENATVGAGAVVNKDVEPGATVVGIPAKQINKQRPAEPPAAAPQSIP
jgi:sugar O-acyltransferase (sialic acid O-acetyltransferase NeuD family)